MPTLTIDQQEVTVPEGATILQAAEALGITIPTLCFEDGLKPQTSCMVCVVKLAGTNRYLPACGTPAAEGMNIESETEEVHATRRNALELLLGDHLGDCEAPCRLAHPNQMNIPAMIRAIQAEDWEKVRTLLGEHVQADPEKVPPYERACRRGRKDQPVAIESLIAFACQKTGAAPLAEPPAEKPKRPFTVSMGAIDEDEMQEYSRVVSQDPQIQPAGELYTLDEAKAEAARCLHCDCRKPTSCRLRYWAEKYNAKPTKYRKKHRPYELQDQHPEILYEPGKCIACGLCVQIAANEKERLGLTFIGRGFDVKVAVPFDKPMQDAFENAARKAAETCPTAALVVRGHEEV